MCALKARGVSESTCRQQPFVFLPPFSAQATCALPVAVWHPPSLGSCPGLRFLLLPSLPAPSLEGLINHRLATAQALFCMEKRRPPCLSLEIADSVHTSHRIAELSALQSCNSIFKLLLKLVICLYFGLSPRVGAVCMSGNGWEKVKWKSCLLLNCHNLPPRSSPVFRSCPRAAYSVLRYQFTLSIEVQCAGWSEYTGLEGSLVHARKLQTGF